MVALMMQTRTWWTVIFGLFAVIVIMLGFMISLPISKPSPAIVVPATSTNSTNSEETPTSGSQKPLSSRVIVTTPQAKSTVGRTFTVAGVAPGPWFFEAQFPIQVRDVDGNVIGRTNGTAQGDWMTEKLVTFTATIQIDATYHGPAKLILMKDNPSGMPENDDAIEVPIVID